MIFGTQVGVAPGSLAMRLGSPQLCPPDPVWNYFPPPGEPLSYFKPPQAQSAPAASQPCVPICVTPPNMEPPRTSPPPTITTSPPTTTQEPPPSSIPSNFVRGYLDPYADHARLNGLRGALGRAFGEAGPFGLTWGGFVGVMAIALGGGIGLGYLSKRRR